MVTKMEAQKDVKCRKKMTNKGSYQEATIAIRSVLIGPVGGWVQKPPGRETTPDPPAELGTPLGKMTTSGHGS